MKFKPEATEVLEGIPKADPGTYTMQIVRWKEDVKTANGLRDVIDFAGDNGEGITVGTALWVGGPQRREDGSMSKGNVWQYRRLAEALGPDALSQYKSLDPDGFSCFCPTDWKDRWVRVEVGKYGVDSIEEADPAVVKYLNAGRKSETEAKQDTPAKPVNDFIADDDIPF